jgi:uncharacterized membrane protein
VSEAEQAEQPHAGDEVVVLEARWPVVASVAAYIALSVGLRIAVPSRESLGPHWLIPAVEMALLVALVAADPARLTRRHRLLRRIGIGLVLALLLAALVSASILVRDLLIGGNVTDSAGSLLASGALIWLGNVLVFGLLYWLLDSGGPRARYHGEHPCPDFAFTQQMSPELAPPGWRPQYIDYLILGLTTSTAFSPTDVLPLSRWAKVTMAAQSLLSLVVVALVIARAVNVFS